MEAVPSCELAGLHRLCRISILQILVGRKMNLYRMNSTGMNPDPKLGIVLSKHMHVGNDQMLFLANSKSPRSGATSGKLGIC